MIVSGSGTNDTVEFDNGSYSQSSLGPLARSQWYRVQSPEGTLIGTLFANVADPGVWSVVDTVPDGNYQFVAVAGGTAFAVEVGPWLPIVPVGVHKTPADYRPWLSQFGLGTADLSTLSPTRFDDAWLLDRNPLVFVSGALMFQGVAVSADSLSATFAVRAVESAGTADVTRLNGRLVLMGASSPAGPFEEVADLSSEVGEKTFGVSFPATARFFKLMVVFPPE